MSRKIIIDCDPGIDDAIALVMALFDPRLNVLAITPTAGTIEADVATHNVAALLSALDPPRYPRLGTARPSENAAVMDDRDLHGSDGLGEVRLPASPRQHSTPSEKVMGDLLQQHPGEITIVCLGPLTNLARLCQFEPTAVELIDKVVISGGCVSVPGNASPVAERNMHFDPVAAERVLSSALTKQMVPLDVTDEVTFGVELLEQLPSKYSRAGALLHKWLPFAFRTAHQKLGREVIPLYDPTTLVAAIDPEAFTWETVAGKVETKGRWTSGMTVFDRRLRGDWAENLDVAVGVDEEHVRQCIVQGLRYAGAATD